MRETLPKALELMFGHEGGYVNSPNDRGGPTKYGITHTTLARHRGVRSVTPAQVKALTLAEAEDIYRKSYWGQSGGDILPVGLDYAAFDFGVNSGPARAVKVLQRLVGAKVDGIPGPNTLAAVRAYPGGVRRLIVDYCDARMDYLRSIRNPVTGFPKNGRGWTIRVTGKDPKGEWAQQPGVVGHALALEARNTPPSSVGPTPSGPPPSTSSTVDWSSYAAPGAILVVAALAVIYFLGG